MSQSSDNSVQPNLVLQDLAALIAARKGSDPDQSYTASLLSAGVEKCARKFGEEAVETIVALLSGKPKEIKAEAADVLYHLLVALEAADIRFEEVLSVLESRGGLSGHAEKASRSK